MSFFYSTPAGAVDFWTLFLAVGFSILLGKGEIRAIALALFSQFMVMRAGVVFFGAPGAVIIGLGAISVSVFLVGNFYNSLISKAFVGLCLTDLLVHAGYGLLPNWFLGMTTAVLYLEILLVIGGGARDGFLYLNSTGRNSGGAHSNGFIFRNSFVYKKRQPK
jgi:hypothetical protein